MSPALSRRRMIQLAISASAATPAFAASPFWSKKAATEWSPDEVHQILTKSPWAKKVIGEMPGAGGPESAGNLDAGAAGAGMSRPGGTPNAARMGDGGLVGGEQGGRGGDAGPRRGGGAGSVPEVTVRWDSAKPVLAVLKGQLPPELNAHYALTLLGFPPQMMTLGLGRGSSLPEDPAGRQKALVDSLLAAATLSMKGRDPLHADQVLLSQDRHALIFGFPRQSLPIAATDPDVTFTLKLGPLTIKTKFTPKDMVYDGELAV